MEDKNLYNKVMLIAFCIILCTAGSGNVQPQHSRTAGLRELRSQRKRPGSTIGNRAYRCMNTVLIYIRNMAPYMAYAVPVIWIVRLIAVRRLRKSHRSTTVCHEAGLWCFLLFYGGAGIHYCHSAQRGWRVYRFCGDEGIFEDQSDSVPHYCGFVESPVRRKLDLSHD